MISLTGLLGAAPEELERRLGAPDVDRRAGGQRWLVWEIQELGILRIRCSPRVASWTLTFADPLPASLRLAATAVDLWPELGPEADGGESARGLVRREVRDGSGSLASATAALGADGVRRLAVFDEEPEW